MIDNILYSNVWNEFAINDAKKISGPILVIGGGGFIGSNLFFSLNSVRDDVFTCSRNPRQSWRLNGIDEDKIISLDITDFGRTRYVINSIKPRTIFNLSAFGAYSRQKDFEKIHLTNYIGTLNLIMAIQEVGCDAFVHAGTSSEYGLNCSEPDENSELIPNSDYSVSKIAASYLIKYYGKMAGLPAVNLRLYSVYGPWEERDRLIPVLISNNLRGEFPSFVGENISRDYIYIDDCTHAFVRAAITVCKTHPGISINIGTGKKTTIGEVAKIAADLFGILKKPEFGSMINRQWDLSDWYAKTNLAKELMNWEYSIDFKKGLKLTSEWEKEAQKRIEYLPNIQKTKKISVIIACYKDNQSIPILYEDLSQVFKETGNDYEIIFVNDCSPFNDEDIIMGLAVKDSHVMGISHSRNFGSQSAFISGMEISTGDAVVLMDGDGQDPPIIIKDFIKKWEEGYTIVYGERIKREAPLYMQMLYKLFYRIFKRLADISIPLDAGDFSLIDRKAVNYLIEFHEKDIFLRGLRAWIGFKQTGVPYYRKERLFGKTTNSFIKNIWWAKKAIFSFSMKPLHYIQIIGFLTFFITINLGILYLINYLRNPDAAVRGVTTIIMLILGIGSIQIISISILGDYIGKITEEVKNRPKFIRNKLIFNGKKYDEESSITKIIKNINNSRS